MSTQIAVGVAVGTPDVAGQVPLTASNFAGYVAQAIADNDNAATNIATATTDVGTAGTDATRVIGAPSVPVIPFRLSVGNTPRR